MEEAAFRPFRGAGEAAAAGVRAPAAAGGAPLGPGAAAPAVAAARPPFGSLRCIGLKGKTAQGYSVLSRRKPRSKLRVPGEERLRFGARQYQATPTKLPPRFTRFEPEPGPPGSVTAPPG